jgi:transposase
VDWKSAPLLPVNLISEAAESEPAKPSDSLPLVENVCEVEFEHARLRIRGDVSPTILRLLIRELSQ